MKMIWKWMLWVSVILFGLLLAGCNPNPQPTGLTPIPTLAVGLTPSPVSSLQTQGAQGPTVSGATAAPGQGVAAAGAALYEESCSPCHGDQGQGVDSPALRNNDFVKSGGDAAVFDTVSKGRPGTRMPGWLIAVGGPYSDQQINNILAYLHSFQGVAAIPTATAQPEEATETPLPPNAPTPEPARPSNEGNPGPAASLTGDTGRGQLLFGQVCAGCHGPQGVQGVPNPGSEDGSVPPLNPIDPTIANPDAKVFATNVDLFIEHGSVPDGPSPLIVMPGFGDSKLLQPQQIADVIAYVISLNGGK